jgi:hypothetical protein
MDGSHSHRCNAGNKRSFLSKIRGLFRSDEAAKGDGGRSISHQFLSADDLLAMQLLHAQTQGELPYPGPPMHGGMSPAGNPYGFAAPPMPFMPMPPVSTPYGSTVHANSLTASPAFLAQWYAAAMAQYYSSLAYAAQAQAAAAGAGAPPMGYAVPGTGGLSATATPAPLLHRASDVGRGTERWRADSAAASIIRDSMNTPGRFSFAGTATGGGSPAMAAATPPYPLTRPASAYVSSSVISPSYSPTVAYAPEIASSLSLYAASRAGAHASGAPRPAGATPTASDRSNAVAGAGRESVSADNGISAVHDSQSAHARNGIISTATSGARGGATDTNRAR